MKNENYSLTDQRYSDRLAASGHLPLGCELRRNLRQAEKKLRKVEKKLRFSVQTEKIWPLPGTYNEKDRKNEKFKMAEKTGVNPQRFLQGEAQILAPFPETNWRNRSNWWNQLKMFNVRIPNERNSAHRKMNVSPPK
jgi:hypothetical protein